MYLEKSIDIILQSTHNSIVPGFYYYAVSKPKRDFSENKPWTCETKKIHTNVKKAKLTQKCLRQKPLTDSNLNKMLKHFQWNKRYQYK